MDGQRFDAVAKLLGGGASRRSVVKGIFAAAIGGVAAGRGLTARAGECIPDGNSCEGDGCCSGVCDAGTCAASCGDQFSGCEGEGQSTCCDGFTCQQSKGRICLPCVEADDGCNVDGDCCAGLVCSDSVCVAACIAPGESCAPAQGIENPCCDGFVCNDDLICAEPCITEGQPCEGGCCDGLRCIREGEGNVGVCSSCVDSGAECGSDDDCCGALVCNLDTGVCGPVEATVSATLTIHVAECASGVGSDIFAQCHDNVLSGVTFTVDADGAEVQTLAVVTTTSGGNGVTGTILVGAAASVSEDPAVVARYVGVYVYCAEQASGDVRFDGAAANGAFGVAVADGDDVICDVYNLTEGTAPPPSGTVTKLPATGSGADDAGHGGLLGAAALGGAAALLAARKLRGEPGPTKQ